MSAERERQLAGALTAVRQRIDRAALAAGRDPAELTLIVVTKTFPASDVIALARLGVADMGENRHQEAEPKFAEAFDTGARFVRHMIGQLQTNKAAAVARYADVVHSVDRSALVSALDKALRRLERSLSVLVQVDLDGATGRGGVHPDGLLDLADEIAANPRLTLRGVMAVAPLGADPDEAFATLRDLAEQLRRRHPQAGWISAGMSGDLEAAVRHGATHLRVGTAILGSRPSLL